MDPINPAVDPQQFIKLFADRELLSHLIATLVLLVSVLVVRYVALRFVRRALPSRDKLRLRWSSQIRGLSYAIMAFGLLTIWAAELQTLAVSFVVLAMARGRSTALAPTPSRSATELPSPRFAAT